MTKKSIISINFMNTVTEEFERHWVTSLIGFFLLCFGVWMLTWNEGRAVHHAHSLDETYNNAIILNMYEKPSEEHNGKVVHASGNIQIDEPLTEFEYGIAIQAVKLKRRVQMYQWVEERTPRNEDNNIDTMASMTHDYYYVTEWRDKLIDSSNFYIRHGHVNPKEIPLKTVTYISPVVKLGHLLVGNEIKNKFDDFVEVASDERPDRRDVKLHMGIYYHCNDVWNPEVGDIRVQFYYAGGSGEPVTIIAKHNNGVLVPYETSKGHQIALLRQGNLNLNQMFSEEHFDARLETWKLRGLGFFILYASTVCLSKLIKIMVFQVPLFNFFSGDPLSFGNIVLAFSLALCVIATAWVMYRPMLGASLFFAAVSPFLYYTMGVYNEHNIRIN